MTASSRSVWCCTQASSVLCVLICFYLMALIYLLTDTLSTDCIVLNDVMANNVFVKVMNGADHDLI
jgi:hypothetical protein